MVKCPKCGGNGIELSLDDPIVKKKIRDMEQLSGYHDPYEEPVSQDKIKTYDRIATFRCAGCGYVFEDFIKGEKPAGYNGRYGWICPRCGQVWHPWVTKCDCKEDGNP